MTPVETYRAGRTRSLELVAVCDVETPAPACPGWRVRDVVVHVTGIAMDFLPGRLPVGDLGVWTAEQVALRRDRDFSEVLSE